MSVFLPRETFSIRPIIDALLAAGYSKHGVPSYLENLDSDGWTVEEISDGHRSVSIVLGDYFEDGRMNPSKRQFKQLQLAVDSKRRVQSIISYRNVKKKTKTIWV